MLSSLIRSKTLLGLSLTYVLSSVLVAIVRFSKKGSTVFSELLYTHWAFGWSEQLESLIPTVCLILLAGTVVFSRIRFREIKETLANRNMSMVAFVAIACCQTNVLLTRPDVLMSSLILTMVFMLIFYTYKREGALSEVFHVGLGIGVASLFVGQSIFLMLAVAFSLLVLRTGNLKEWFVFLMGLIMTAVFVAMVVVWADVPTLEFKRVVQSAWIARVSVPRLTTGHIVLLGLILLSLSTLLSNLTTGTIHLRNVSLVNLGWIVGVALMVVLLGVDWQSGLILAAFPLSNLLAQFIDSMNRWWVADILLVLLIAAPILSILLPL